MPNILSIETSADACSVSLICDDHLVSREAEQPRSHARMLVPLIEELLDAEATKLDAVCVDAGPGSYTGLRIGVSTAKGLAWSLGIPLHGISSMALMAAGAVLSDGHVDDAAKGRRFRSIIPARGNEVYTALYAWNGSEMEVLEQPGVQSVEDVSGPTSDELLIAATSSMAERLGVKDGSALVIAPHSSQASLLLRNPGDVYRVEDVSSFEPLYLREFEAKKPAVSIFDRLPF